MGRLDGYIMDKHPFSTTKPFFTVNHSAILFSKSAVESLSYAPYVHVFFNPEKGSFAIQPCKEDQHAVAFYKTLSKICKME